MPVSNVTISVRVRHFSKAMPVTMLEFSFVSISVMVYHCSIAMPVTILEFSFVSISVRIFPFSIATGTNIPSSNVRTKFVQYQCKAT
jgi:hypothetical protein